MLTHVNDIDKNIMTLEDPVEYKIPLIRQSNIKTDIGMDFASGIRTLLRQDPDIILVGEIRDKETAIAAIQAAMTGHQVLTSLHTNDAISSIPRLKDIGVPTFLMSGALIGVVAQRLAKRLCTKCKYEKPVTAVERKLLGEVHSKVKKLYHSKGCSKCGNTGYSGRVVINEILSFDKELDELVARNATRKEIYDNVIKKDFVPIAEDGLEKAVKGLIDIKSLMSVIDLTDRLDLNDKIE